MNDFFLLKIPVTSETDWSFSAGHLVWLIFGILFCVLMSSVYKRSKRKKRIRVAVAAAAAFLEVFRALLLMSVGEYSVQTLPLHLCGLAVYLNLIHAVRGNRRLGKFLYAFCFPGAVFALVFPDWYYFPFFNILTFIAFLLHILVACYPLMQVSDLKPSIKDAPSNLLIMVAMAIPIYVFDWITNTNYMFLNWPVPPLTLFEFLGRPGYLIGYLPLLAVTWLIIYVFV